MDYGYARASTNADRQDKQEIITVDDEHYDVIRKFFFGKLNDYVSEQIRRIEKCAQQNWRNKVMEIKTKYDIDVDRVE